MNTFQRHACLSGLLLITSLSGCDRLDMYDQPRYEPLEASKFFADGLSARQPVEGTIPRGGLREDEEFFTGKSSGKLIAAIPEAAYQSIYHRQRKPFKESYDETDKAQLRHVMLERGRQRYEIYCSVCHGRTGDGRGMIVQRGFRQPPDYVIDRLRKAPNGHFFDVISNGFGAMSSYASRIEVADRWAIVAYIRALQLSQSATLEDLPPDHRPNLGATRTMREPPTGKEVTE